MCKRGGGSKVGTVAKVWMYCQRRCYDTAMENLEAADESEVFVHEQWRRKASEL